MFSLTKAKMEVRKFILVTLDRAPQVLRSEGLVRMLPVDFCKERCTSYSDMIYGGDCLCNQQKTRSGS